MLTEIYTYFTSNQANRGTRHCLYSSPGNNKKSVIFPSIHQFQIPVTVLVTAGGHFHQRIDLAVDALVSACAPKSNDLLLIRLSMNIISLLDAIKNLFDFCT